jgi:hypothetical protein
VILDDLQEERRHCKLKEEIVDRAVWGTCFGKGCRPVLRQTMLLLVVIRAWRQGSGCTAAIRLIVHPIFYKFPLSPPDVSTSYATREIRAARGVTLMGEKD